MPMSAPINWANVNNRAKAIRSLWDGYYGDQSLGAYNQPVSMPIGGALPMATQAAVQEFLPIEEQAYADMFGTPWARGEMPLAAPGSGRNVGSLPNDWTLKPEPVGTSLPITKVVPGISPGSFMAYNVPETKPEPWTLGTSLGKLPSVDYGTPVNSLENMIDTAKQRASNPSLSPLARASEDLRASALGGLGALAGGIAETGSSLIGGAIDLGREIPGVRTMLPIQSDQPVPASPVKAAAPVAIAEVPVQAQEPAPIMAPEETPIEGPFVTAEDQAEFERLKAQHEALLASGESSNAELPQRTLDQMRALLPEGYTLGYFEVDPLAPGAMGPQGSSASYDIMKNPPLRTLADMQAEEMGGLGLLPAEGAFDAQGKPQIRYAAPEPAKPPKDNPRVAPTEVLGRIASDLSKVNEGASPEANAAANSLRVLGTNIESGALMRTRNWAGNPKSIRSTLVDPLVRALDPTLVDKASAVNQIAAFWEAYEGQGLPGITPEIEDALMRAIDRAYSELKPLDYSTF